MGVATVLVLMAIVRRTFGAAAAVIAGLVAALTPAAVLIFRYNNPDALLTLLLVGSAYAFIRSLERGSLRWVALAAALVGLAFNTKYLQGWLVLPAFAAVWTIARSGQRPPSDRRAGGRPRPTIVASGWWVLVVQLLPASRAAVHRRQHERIGARPAPRLRRPRPDLRRAAAAPAAAAARRRRRLQRQRPGCFRLFNDQFGGQVAWFLPLARRSASASGCRARRAPRTDLRRAAYLMWGLWLAVHVVVFSFMSGIIHTYYVGRHGSRDRRPRRRRGHGALGDPEPVAAPALGRDGPRGGPGRLGRPRVAPPRSHARLRPRSVDRPRGGRAGRGRGHRDPGPARRPAGPARRARARGRGPASAVRPRTPSTRCRPRMAAATRRPVRGRRTGWSRAVSRAASHRAASAWRPSVRPTARRPPERTGGPGAGSLSTTVTDYLVANCGSASWIVAVSSANQADRSSSRASQPVMAMGGFSGSDPTPTLEQFQALRRERPAPVRDRRRSGRGAGR